MNVLMFAMTMLLILATMTYARLDSFRSFQIAENQFERYMEKSGEQFANITAENRYKTTIVNPRPVPNKPKQKKTPGTSKLSWSIFIDANERSQDPSKQKKISELSKKLIFNLFENQPTVQKMIENNPDILDRLLISLINTVDNAANSIKITNIAELSSLDLQDEELNLLRYELLKSNRFPLDVKGSNGKDSYSLLDHLTHRPGKTRIYLASKPLLKSIFNQEDALVTQIIEKRKSLYHEVKSNKSTNDQATLLFEAWIKTVYPYFDENLFECTVTKTDPRKYE